MPDYSLCTNNTCKARFMCQRFTTDKEPELGKDYAYYEPSENNCEGWMNEEYNFYEIVLYNWFKCTKCGHIITAGFIPKFIVCTQPMPFRTSGICGGSYELVK